MSSATSTENKEASNINTAAGSKGLESTGGVEGALQKEREARGESQAGGSAHNDDHKAEGPGAGVGAAN